MEDEERKVDLSHRTIQDEQARLRKKRQKAENVFAVFKKPLHESLTSVLPVMLIVLVLCFTIAPVPNNAMVAFLLGGLMLICAPRLILQPASSSSCISVSKPSGYIRSAASIIIRSMSRWDALAFSPSHLS